MDYWHLIFQIPAIISGATIVSDLLPFTLDRRYVALLVFLVALVVLNAPVIVSLALGLVLVSSIVSKYLGVSFSGKEPVPFGKYRTAITHAVQEKTAGWRKKIDAFPYLTRAYPEGTEEMPEAEDEPVQATVVRKFVPDLPGA